MIAGGGGAVERADPRPCGAGAYTMWGVQGEGQCWRPRTAKLWARAQNSDGMTTNLMGHGSADRAERMRLRAVLVRFQRPSTARALWQLFDTVVPYALL